MISTRLDVLAHAGVDDVCARFFGEMTSHAASPVILLVLRSR